jgi:hypothetical protein
MVVSAPGPHFFLLRRFSIEERLGPWFLDRSKVDRRQDVAQHALGKELPDDRRFGVGCGVNQTP